MRACVDVLLGLHCQGQYHPLFRNCEHFARFCKTGQGASLQVTAVLVAASERLERRARQLSAAARPQPQLLYEGAVHGDGACRPREFVDCRPPLLQGAAACAARGVGRGLARALALAERRARRSDEAWRAELRRQAAAAAAAAPAGPWRPLAQLAAVLAVCTPSNEEAAARSNEVEASAPRPCQARQQPPSVRPPSVRAWSRGADGRTMVMPWVIPDD
jgi:hypothetical protein